MYRIGTKLSIGDISGTVIGYINYSNPQDGNKAWTEYRLYSSSGEYWLSIDDEYKEYSISYPANFIKGNIGPEWHKVDEGYQVVKGRSGDVDVDYGERARFIEYEDEEEEKTLSVEMWSDGTEYSLGHYIELSEIVDMGYDSSYTPRSYSSGSSEEMSPAFKKILTTVMVLFFLLPMFGGVLTTAFASVLGGNNLSKYISKRTTMYKYETSITGNEKQKADVYRYAYGSTTDEVAMDIINGIDGNTESVSQEDDKENQTIGILTKKEYALVYHPEGEADDVVFVQVSKRKFNYTSDRDPYKSSVHSSSWYRSHYYSSAYSKDATSYKKTPSAYSMYDGDTIHNIGNGYFDSYSNSVKQASIRSRQSSSGGISSGK